MNSKSAKHLRTATTAYTSCILGSKNKSQVGAMSHCHQLDLYTKHARFIHKDTLSNQVCNWPKKKTATLAVKILKLKQWFRA